MPTDEKKDLFDVFGQAYGRIKKEFNADWVQFYFVDEGKLEPWVEETTSEEHDELARRCLAEQQTVISRDCTTSAALLAHADRPLGVMSIYRQKAFNDSEIDSQEALAT